MLITIISECQKNALERSRLILDSFAERIGTNTWQTLITEQGLDSLHAELRKTASKSTAIACHWHRSRTRTDLLWTVGRSGVFNTEGRVPVNLTGQEAQGFMEKDKWRYLPLIKALSNVAALFHDWGKSNKAFQSKLTSSTTSPDAHRHEWLSVLFLKALYLSDQHQESWLDSLVAGTLAEKKLRATLNSLSSEAPFKGVNSNTLLLLMWLILSHHRLPLNEEIDYTGDESGDLQKFLSKITARWNYTNFSEKEDAKQYEKTYSFSGELLINSPTWLSEVKKGALELRRNVHLLEKCVAEGSFRSVITQARLCLMLGDHHYSSKKEVNEEWESTLKLYANTKDKQVDQHLDNHLYYVAEYTTKTARLLPKIENELPFLQNETLLQASPAKYLWQDIAVKKITAKASAEEVNSTGFFGINLASTGCGKTIGNAKIMHSIGSRAHKGSRFTVALGLRTLTAQTGDEYIKRLKLKPDELAIVMGASAMTELNAESEDGAESAAPLMDNEVIFPSDIDSEILSTLFSYSKKSKQFLHAPTVVCTIDHLMQATESTRGGAHILPSLRLLSSDLIIDEVDDFTGSDEIAIARLIHLAGMLGKRVLLSSATITPRTAEGHFHAYESGWEIYAKTKKGMSTSIQCAWVDEFHTKTTLLEALSTGGSTDTYRANHAAFCKKRVEKLSSHPVRRKGNVVITPDKSKVNKGETHRELYYECLLAEVIRKHEAHHSSHANLTVSLGVIRVAHIKTAVTLTQYLLECNLPPGVAIRVMAYHSNQVLLLRHHQEEYLDGILQRSEEPDAYLKEETIKRHLEEVEEDVRQVIFIVVATPVEEVGRDHDFDWAVIEPSSYRSFIQMAGRVKRHRLEEVETANIALMQFNLNAFKDGDAEGKIYYRHPGYENAAFKLPTHDLKECINVKDLAQCLDARPRMIFNNDRASLIGIEHLSIDHNLCSYDRKCPFSLEGYLSANWWLSAYPQKYHQFRKSAPSTIIYLIYDQKNDECYFSEKRRGNFTLDITGLPMKSDSVLNIQHKPNPASENSRVWLERDYLEILRKTAQRKQLTLLEASKKYGEVSFTQYEDYAPYIHNELLGLHRS